MALRSLPFSIDGVVDDPDDTSQASLDLEQLEALFSGYEIVDHAKVSLTPVLLENGDTQNRPAASRSRIPVQLEDVARGRT